MVACSSALLCGCGGERNKAEQSNGGLDSGPSANSEGEHESGDAGPNSANSNDTDATHSTPDSADSAADEGDDDDGDDSVLSPRFDIGFDETGDMQCDPDSDDLCGCTGVDILFVIDNSVSMETHQRSLGMAFPLFVDAIVDALPAGIVVHVGVTSSEMGYTGSGTTQNCFAVDGDRWYITPDTAPSGRNGAQGRLFESSGQAFFEFATDSDAATLDRAKAWFAGAAAIGTGGSNVEMTCAAAGWMADPANAAANEGFLRDEGAVLVVFFVQDEPDQTPTAVGGDAMLEKLALAKSRCGGRQCIVAGGLVNAGCLDQVPLGEFFDGLEIPPIVEDIPALGSVDPSEYVRVLRDNLAQVIVQTCKQIDPPG